MRFVKVALLLLIPAVVYAQPSISGVSGTLAHGQTVTISGSGFGTKTQAAPVAWDNWEDGTLGTPTVGAWSSTTGLQGVSTSFPRHFRTSYSAYKQNWTQSGDDAYAAVRGGSDSPKWYVSYWFRFGSDWVWSPTYTPGSSFLGNVKFIRLWSTGSINENFVCAQQSNWVAICANEQITPAVQWVQGGCCGETTFNLRSAALETWHLFEFEFQDSTVNTTDGIFRAWFNGSLVIDSATSPTGLETREDFTNNKRPFIAGFYNSWGSGTALVQLDDAVIDNTWARVLLCSGSTWNARGQCEFQPATSWSATSINVTFNQGAFSNGSQQYLYVVSDDGQRSSGFQVTLAGGSGGTFKRRYLLWIGLTFGGLYGFRHSRNHAASR